MAGMLLHFDHVCCSSLVMERVWRDLPLDILENVVTFLPLTSVLRFKTVSRRWNRLISQDREFALRHTRARAEFPEEYVFVTGRFDAYESFPLRGWEVMDVEKKRCFSLSNDFVTEYAKRERLVPASLHSKTAFNERAVLAADGGLFCVLLLLSAPSSILLVCNSVLRAFKRLPNLTDWVANGHRRVVMKTDRASMKYELFVVNHLFSPDAMILIYESKTGAWRTAPTTPSPSNCEATPWRFVSRDEFFESYFCHHPSRAGIISYNTSTGDLSGLGVVLKTTNLQLVVCDNRLFCVTWSDSGFPYVKICEIILGRKRYIWLALMPSEFMSLGEFANEPFVAVGCANAILICSGSGRSMAYNLSSRSWHHYPHNHLREALQMFGKPYQEVVGFNYCLSLCPP